MTAVQSLYLHNTRLIRVSIKLITEEGKKCEEGKKRWGNQNLWNASLGWIIPPQQKIETELADH